MTADTLGVQANIPFRQGKGTTVYPAFPLPPLTVHPHSRITANWMHDNGWPSRPGEHNHTSMLGFSSQSQVAVIVLLAHQHRLIKPLGTAQGMGHGLAMARRRGMAHMGQGGSIWIMGPQAGTVQRMSSRISQFGRWLATLRGLTITRLSTTHVRPPLSSS